MKKALIVGIDDYPVLPLAGCVNDAIAMAELLGTNGDGSPNFSIKQLTSNVAPVTTAELLSQLEELFSGTADTALFYFAGHGLINPATDAGHIVSQDGKKGSWGIPLWDVLTLASKASPKIRSSVIILDSCQSGALGEVPAVSNDKISMIGDGVTILTASQRSQGAAEFDGHGLFTGILLDSLRGSSADILGRITPASIYSHVDQTLGPWEQRPVYKANVHNFVCLRQVAPKVSPEILRQLPKLFVNPTDVFALDPSFEPDRENVPAHLRNVPVDPNNAVIFKDLQTCNRFGLIVPVNAQHMYYAAINSTGCRLTALGAHYRMLAELKRI